MRIRCRKPRRTAAAAVEGEGAGEKAPVIAVKYDAKKSLLRRPRQGVGVGVRGRGGRRLDGAGRAEAARWTARPSVTAQLRGGTGWPRVWRTRRISRYGGGGGGGFHSNSNSSYNGPDSGFPSQRRRLSEVGDEDSETRADGNTGFSGSSGGGGGGGRRWLVTRSPRPLLWDGKLSGKEKGVLCVSCAL